MGKNREATEESPTRRAVRAMTAAGEDVRDIASALGISTQAVYKHLAKIEREKKAS